MVDAIDAGSSSAHTSPSHTSPQPPRREPSTRPKQAGPYVTSAIGGSLSKLSFGIAEGQQKPKRYRSTRKSGGGPRGRIKGFSRGSRKRLLQRTASINWNRFDAKAFAVTLTYPTTWPTSPETWKTNLDTFSKRLKRRYPGFSAVWRMEFQGRGAPHFHIILFVPRPFRESLKELRAFIAQSWYEACGQLNPQHLKAGTEVRPISSIKRLNHYARYIAKPEKLRSDVPNPGRLWGVWGRQHIPVDWETVRITVEQAIKLRRILRRLARLKPSGPLRGMQVFVRYDTIVRVLSWMGCYRG